MASELLIKTVVATAEVMGAEFTESGAEMMCADLAEYPEPAVLEALAKCRREVRGKLTLADVIKRIDDGRPGPNEAWAMIPHSDSETVVWTEEMSIAMACALPLLEMGEKIAARMAFIERYELEVSRSRGERRPVNWLVSLGWDKAGREPVIRQAVEQGRISRSHALKLLPHGHFEENVPDVPRIGAPVQMQQLLAKGAKQ